MTVSFYIFFILLFKWYLISGYFFFFFFFFFFHEVLFNAMKLQCILDKWFSNQCNVFAAKRYLVCYLVYLPISLFFFLHSEKQMSILSLLMLGMCLNLMYRSLFLKVVIMIIGNGLKSVASASVAFLLLLQQHPTFFGGVQSVLLLISLRFMSFSKFHAIHKIYTTLGLSSLSNQFLLRLCKFLLIWWKNPWFINFGVTFFFFFFFF